MNPEPPTDVAEFAGMRLISAADVAARTSTADAVDALEAALVAGLDPENDAPRSRVTTATGELLVMPSTLGEFSGVKLLSSTPDNATRDQPLIQGAMVLFEGPGQRPAAVVDGIALTNLRTPAVSALAVRHLAPAPAGPERLTVFGTGPQAVGHAVALCEVREIGEVTLVGRTAAALEAAAEQVRHATGITVTTRSTADCADAVSAADLICCCTSAPTPVLDGSLVQDTAVVVAMGSHFPDERETDDALVERAGVVVESRASTLREAGDVVIPIAAGLLSETDLVTLADVVAGRAAVDLTRPRLFKGTGMPWEDLVVAAEIYRASTAADAAAPNAAEDR